VPDGSPWSSPTAAELRSARRSSGAGPSPAGTSADVGAGTSSLANRPDRCAFELAYRPPEGRGIREGAGPPPARPRVEASLRSRNCHRRMICASIGDSDLWFSALEGRAPRRRPSGTDARLARTTAAVVRVEERGSLGDWPRSSAQRRTVGDHSHHPHPGRPIITARRTQPTAPRTARADSRLRASG